MSAPSVVLAGGGSAGHVSPLLATADALRRLDPETRITALGTTAGLEARLVPQRGYELRTLPKVVFPRRLNAAALRLPRGLAEAVSRAGEAIDAAHADVVVGFGGYVSSPAYLAARRRGVPIVVHEQNARPGLANRLGAALTPHVLTTFASTRLPHARAVGMPMRTEITGITEITEVTGRDRAAMRAEARREFGLEPDRPTLLVTGGSLGAARLNGAFAAAAPDLVGAGIQVLHLTGAGKEVDPGVDSGYVTRAYADRMDLAYAAADLVVARSGANTVCEITAVGLPAIFVPLPIGNGEQRLNAADVVAAGGARLVPDAQVDADWVRAQVVPLLAGGADAPELAAMAAASAAQGRPGADVEVARVVREAAGFAASGSTGASA